MNRRERADLDRYITRSDDAMEEADDLLGEPPLRADLGRVMSDHRHRAYLAHGRACSDRKVAAAFAAEAAFEVACHYEDEAWR